MWHDAQDSETDRSGPSGRAGRRGTVERKIRGHNYDAVAELVAGRVAKTQGRISAKRLLPAAWAAGYEGSPRNFRRVVAEAKAGWRRDHHRGRRSGVWAPGEVLIIDWGLLATLHVFCAVLAWSQFRFVRLSDNERASTTFELLGECFEVLGGVPQVVLGDRMGCLKAGVVANVVVPTPGYVRFATHYGFRPDFCHAADPQSKCMVERLVSCAKSDLASAAPPDQPPANPDKINITARRRRLPVRALPRRRHRVRQRLTHRPPVHPCCFANARIDMPRSRESRRIRSNCSTLDLSFNNLRLPARPWQDDRK